MTEREVGYGGPVLGGKAVKDMPAVVTGRPHVWLTPAVSKEVTVVRHGDPRSVPLP